MSNVLEDTLGWLDARQAGVPAALGRVVRDAVVCTERTHGTPEGVLREAADRLLAESIDPHVDPNPTTLLAADALITYVCEYRSAFAPDTLQSLQ